MRPGPLAFALAAASLLGAAPALSEEGEPKEPDPFFEQRGIDDRLGFFIGGISSTAETRAQIDSLEGIGTSLLLERLFNLPRDRDYPRLRAYYRFSRKHRIDFRHLRLSSSGTKTLFDEDITVGDQIFRIGAEVGARQRVQFSALEYRYSFVNNGRAEAGLLAGLAVSDIDLSIFGTIFVDPGIELTACEHVSETIPLPVAGVFADFTLARRLFLSAEGILLSASYDKYSGSVNETRVALRWYPSKIFGFGVAWSRLRLDVDVALDRGNVSLDFLFEGPSVFVSFLVPGLR